VTEAEVAHIALAAVLLALLALLTLLWAWLRTARRGQSLDSLQLRLEAMVDMLHALSDKSTELQEEVDRFETLVRRRRT